MEIHFPRYRPDDQQDQEGFLNVVATLRSHLPLPAPPDLTEWSDLLFERSIGCVGILKQWLNAALHTALRTGEETITRQILEAEAPKVSQCEQIAREARDGEEQLSESGEKRSQLRALLGLPEGAQGLTRTGTQPSPPHHAKQRPGQRRPVRDPIGEPTDVLAKST